MGPLQSVVSDDTIAAIASPPGGAARGIVRLSGPQSHRCVERLFHVADRHDPFFASGATAGSPGATVGSPSSAGNTIASGATAGLPSSAGNTMAPGATAGLPSSAGNKIASGATAGLPSSVGSTMAQATPDTRQFDGLGLRAPTSFRGELVLPGLASPLPAEVFFWPDERSYTGQPVAEIHTIGSPPLLELVLRTLCTAGARLAGPGEFTLRAFLAGRIDLTQAEAVLGVIDAADPRALDAALAQLAGGLATPLHRLRDSLLDLLAHLEAGLDFADEDIAFITRDDLDRRLANAETEVAALTQQMTSRGEIADAARAVLVGRANAGKSSLFNALAGHSAAIVCDQPGTTRDYLVAELDLDGVKCQLIDTAGMDTQSFSRDRTNAAQSLSRDPMGSAPDPSKSHRHAIDQAAQSAAADQRRRADIQLLCIDATQPLDARHCDERHSSRSDNTIVVLTKCDQTSHIPSVPAGMMTSSVTGRGIAELRAELRRAVVATRGTSGNVVAATASRCFDSLRLAGECLQRARDVAASGYDELVAAEVRTALEELGKVVGAVYTDDVLDRIFSRFCIGK